MNDLRRTITSTVKLPEYCIYYTSSDGKIVTPYSTTAFGTDVSIVSNTYENGVGCIKLNRAPRILDNNAFSGRTTLTSIEIPETVEGIMDKAFYGCNKLTGITIPDSVASIGSSAFYSCSSLTSLVIGSGVASIGDSAFSNCGGLTSLVIGSGVTSIGGQAFQYCRGLTSLVIGSSVTSIGDYAFQSCSSLTSIKSTSVIPATISSYSFPSNIPIYVPDNLVTLYQSKWSSYSSYIQGSGEEITGSTIIRYTTTNGNVITPPSIYTVIRNEYADGVGVLEVLGNISSINSFSGYTTLQSIEIPNSITSIGERAFYNCSKLTGITIPDSVISIGTSAFTSCSNLTSITIPDSVISIGDNAFSACSSLQSITIGNNVTSIGNWVFGGCSSLTIYCEASSKPSGWSSSWNYSYIPVY